MFMTAVLDELVVYDEKKQNEDTSRYILQEDELLHLHKPLSCGAAVLQL